MKEQKTTLIIVITAIFVFIGFISALTFEIVGLLPDIPTKGSEQSIIQNDENILYRSLHDIAQENKVPKYYYDEDGNRLEIEVVDNINFIYKVTKQNDNALKSSMGIIDVYVYINNKEFKIIKWEYRKSE